MSQRKAYQLGREYIRQSRYFSEHIHDPQLLGYLNRLGKKIAANANYRKHSFTFYLVKNRSIGAFALPGGHIVIHTGTVTTAENENELAAVIAHEIAHITQRHIVRRLEESRFDNIFSLAAILAAAAAGSAQGTRAAAVLSQASAIDKRLRYSRKFETEADTIGLLLLHKAGYDVSAMPIFFHRLLQANRIRESLTYEFLNTHPLTINRITEIEQRIHSYPKNNRVSDEEEFQMVRARIIGSYSGERTQNIIDQYASQIQQGDNSKATLYGYAVGLSTKAKHVQARTVINTLKEQYPEDINIQLLEANNEFSADNIEYALQLLENLHTLRKEAGDDSVNLYYANALVSTKHNRQAIPVLRHAIANNYDEPFAHILLARAYGESGQHKESFFERGEYHFLRGNYQFAIEQYQQALNLADNDYDKRRFTTQQKKAEKIYNSVKKYLK